MFTIQGIDLRIAEGTKVPGDLRLEHRTPAGWVPTKMSLAFFLVDFFTENEQHIRQYRSWWRQNGDTYFLRACVQATVKGWRAVADTIERQRDRRAS